MAGGVFGAAVDLVRGFGRASAVGLGGDCSVECEAVEVAWTAVAVGGSDAAGP
ncbi:hypothetical protein Daura_36710 [Dactylosporangium aurantiacum]|uniref:Uncharacterized protein n=1 Tax=Dactylosporangium aurantiacum TaxID=35754 RepID=A0A9Q9ID04_9ACTN|nr:hypothetical protein [Dactylosporangium aurantiacum]MDG6108893.1 hypothetical protein [Dactylosporangium aurantiacum]UWZ52188.1 hypothetical protein Daura_36710 [Dactylosporangium aurantiacum]